MDSTLTWQDHVKAAEYAQERRRVLGHLASAAAWDLMQRGFPAGRNHTGGGWSDEGPPPYQPPEYGYLVSVRLVSDPVLDPTERQPEYHAVVDHAGGGRKEALPAYKVALEAAGYTVAYRKVAYRKKSVLAILAPKEGSE